MRDLKCKDCGQNVHEEDYMLKDGLWTFGQGRLCIDCVERRLGRRLVAGDFSDYAINWAVQPHIPKNEKLVSRLGTREELLAREASHAERLPGTYRYLVTNVSFVRLADLIG